MVFQIIGVMFAVWVLVVFAILVVASLRAAKIPPPSVTQAPPRPPAPRPGASVVGREVDFVCTARELGGYW